MKKLILLLIIPLLFSCNSNKEKKLEVDLSKLIKEEDYVLSVQEKTLSTDVLSVNGLPIKVELSYRYKIIESEVEYLEKNIGPNYHNKIVEPNLLSTTREVISYYLPEELYTNRLAVEDEIFIKTKNDLEKSHINLNSILITSLTLPKELQNEIENKLKEEQIILDSKIKPERQIKKFDNIKTH